MNGLVQLTAFKSSKRTKGISFKKHLHVGIYLFRGGCNLFCKVSDLVRYTYIVIGKISLLDQFEDVSTLHYAQDASTN